MIEVLFLANFHILVLAFAVERARALPDSVHSSKGRTKWKQFFQANVSFKKQTNEFYFTTIRLGAQSSYIVKYFEGSNAVKTTSMRN